MDFQLNLYSITAWGVHAIVPIGVFVLALMNFSKSPRAASLVVAGATLLLFGFVGSVAFNMIASRAFGVDGFLRYAMVANVVATLVNGIGLVLIATGAFVDRDGSTRIDRNPRQSNPSSTPQSPSNNPYVPPQ